MFPGVHPVPCSLGKQYQSYKYVELYLHFLYIVMTRCLVKYRNNFTSYAVFGIIESEMKVILKVTVFSHWLTYCIDEMGKLLVAETSSC
jgi:hypothetical protein